LAALLVSGVAVLWQLEPVQLALNCAAPATGSSAQALKDTLKDAVRLSKPRAIVFAMGFIGRFKR
jgi:hypothetical protein